MIKRIFIIFLFVLVGISSSCDKGDVDDTSKDFPIMTFEKTTHDFGTITQGTVASYSFQFVNTGALDLVISNAVGSCGCTVPEYPTTAIMPGDGGIIKVNFNSAGKSGLQTKTVTITNNTKSKTQILTINANVE